MKAAALVDMKMWSAISVYIRPFAFLYNNIAQKKKKAGKKLVINSTGNFICTL